MQENTLYTCSSFFDIYHNLMFEANFVLEPCNFTILLLKILNTSIIKSYACTNAYLV